MNQGKVVRSAITHDAADYEALRVLAADIVRHYGFWPDGDGLGCFGLTVFVTAPGIGIGVEDACQG